MTVDHYINPETSFVVLDKERCVIDTDSLFWMRDDRCLNLGN